MDSGRLQPALLGGLFIGVLSALPIVSAGNCCCCLWVLGGGVLAVYLRQQNSPLGVEAAEGALLGLMAGFIGGVIGGVLSVLVQMLMGPLMAQWMTAWVDRMNQGGQELPPDFRQQIEQMARGGGSIVWAFLFVIASTIFGMLGGLLGVAIFKKSAPPPPPPPPPTVVVHAPGTAQ